MQARRLAAVAATVIGVGGALLSPSAGRADDSSPLWRPGPSILYAPPATAPQLTNTDPWEARPLLVSGAHAYVEGEFLYQDFLYDDSGANGNLNDPNDKRVGPSLFSEYTGTYTYPTDPRYQGNAADLVELRVKPLDDATAFRITLTELQHPELVAATVGIGTPSSASRQAPDGANVAMPADRFLTVHGGSADIDGTSVPVSVDTNRAQITVRIPHALWNPGTSTVRLSAGVGLWDQGAGRYLLPQQQSSSSAPGGSGTLANPAAFFNVAFRETESPAKLNYAKAPGPPSSCMWRECDQAAALAQNDISRFHDDVDFAKLEAEVTDRSGVPTTGTFDRIFSSHFDFGGGVTYANSNSQVNPAGYKGEYQGRLQPYNVYVPKGFKPNRAYPITVQPHALSANYNQYFGSSNQSDFGERAGGSIVATTEARGPDGWYYEAAEADVFEMWNDVAHHYRLDPTGAVITGYSMGGYASYKLGTRYPDLFAKTFITVGPPADGIWTGPPGVVPATGGDQTNTYFMLESLRWVPILIWHGTNDELVPADGPQLVAQQLDNLGYRYEKDTFPGFDHFAFGFFDNYDWPTQFLTGGTVVVNPPHISYVVNPTMDFADVGLVADHAYWISGLKLGSDTTQVRGNVDVRSEGFCTGDAPASATQFGAGVAATPYTRQFKTWGEAPAAPCADTLDITTTDISTMVVDAQRAHVDCNVKINLTSTDNVPTKVTVVNADGEPCGNVTPAGVGGANVTGVAALPNTSAAAAGGGAGGAAALLGVAVLVSIQIRRRARAWRG